jgi:hypothetical protein
VIGAGFVIIPLMCALWWLGMAILQSGRCAQIFLRIVHSNVWSTQTRHLRRGNQFAAKREAR